GRPRAVAENRQTNFPQLWRVPVHAPDNDSSQTAVLCFERGQIANAAFVESAAIVDDQDVAGLRALNCLQKNIDASKMSSRQRRPGETLIRRDRLNPTGTDSEGNFQAQSSIGNQRSRKLCKRARQ